MKGIIYFVITFMLVSCVSRKDLLCPDVLLPLERETGVICYHVARKIFCGSKADQGECSRRYGIKGEYSEKMYIYRYVGYIKITHNNDIKFVIVDDEYKEKGKQFEKQLNEHGITLYFGDFSSLGFGDLIKQVDGQTRIDKHHKDFRELLRLRLLFGRDRLQLVMLEFCGETNNLAPFYVEPVFVDEGQVYPKAYFENGQSVPVYFNHRKDVNNIQRSDSLQPVQ